MPLMKHFDESKHRRGPKGSKLGGKFVRKDGGSSFTTSGEPPRGFVNTSMGGYSKDTKHATAWVRQARDEGWHASVTEYATNRTFKSVFNTADEAFEFAQTKLNDAARTGKANYLKTLGRYRLLDD